MYRGSDSAHPLHSKYTTFQELCLILNQGQKLPTQDRGSHTTLSITRQFSLMYINSSYTATLVVLIPPQNMFKMFPQISGLENIALFSKAYIGIFQVTIETILFNLDCWGCSLIHHTSLLENLGQR